MGVSVPVVSEVDKAYLAGIIDGEGCIGAAKLNDKRPGRGPGVMFTLFIAMTDREPADLACALYGGHVREKPDKRGGRRMIYCWQAYGDIGARCLRDVRPYLRVKGGQADAYLAARTTFTGGPRKGHQGSAQPTSADIELRFACLHRIQALNQREYLHASC
jgi:hypothetical protein